MNEKEMLAAVKLAANVPADGWGVTWNPLYNPGHCAELIASKQVDIMWLKDCVLARVGLQLKCSRECYGPDISTAQQAMRRAVCLAVIDSAA